MPSRTGVRGVAAAVVDACASRFAACSRRQIAVLARYGTRARRGCPARPSGRCRTAATIAMTAAWTWAGEPRPAVCSQRGGIGQQDREMPRRPSACSAVEAPGSRAWSIDDGVREGDVAAGDHAHAISSSTAYCSAASPAAAMWASTTIADVGVERRRHGRVDERDGRRRVERAVRDHRGDVGACDRPQRHRRRRARAEELGRAHRRP